MQTQEIRELSVEEVETISGGGVKCGAKLVCDFRGNCRVEVTCDF